MPTAASCTAGFPRCMGLSTPLRLLSIGRRRGRQACGALAPRRAGCGRFVHYMRPLRQREPYFLRCKTVVRRADCDLLGSRPFALRGPERATALAAYREEARQASLPCACAAPRWSWSFRSLYEATASMRALSHSVQERGATCRQRPPAQPAFRAALARTRHCACCLSGGGAAGKIALRLCRAALVVVGLRTI